jgi:hypothetical protein
VNPRADAALVRAAAALREVADAVDWAASEARPGATIARGEGWARLDAGVLASLPAAIAKRILQGVAAELGVSLEARHLTALWALVRRPAAGTVSLDLPLGVTREYGALVLGEPPVPAEAVVSIQGDGRYTWRRALPGDRLAGRKLQDLFTNLKVPRRLRGDAVVVMDENLEIVWVEHVGRSPASNVVVTLTRKDPTSISK